MLLGYHFTAGACLRDGRPLPPVGEWLVHEGELLLCSSGLHASLTPFGALQWAPAPKTTLHLVLVGGRVLRDGDRVCATRRKIVASLEALPLCLRYARECALQVADLWACPSAVVDYLRRDETTDVLASVHGMAHSVVVDYLRRDETTDVPPALHSPEPFYPQNWAAVEAQAAALCCARMQDGTIPIRVGMLRVVASAAYAAAWRACGGDAPSDAAIDHWHSDYERRFNSMVQLAFRRLSPETVSALAGRLP